MHEPTITIPVSLLLTLHSQVSQEGRDEIEAYIRDYKKNVDRKGHVAEGFKKDEKGNLFFDFALYDEAVYRGKVETYARSTKEKIEKLKGTLELLQHMSDKQQRLLSLIPDSELARRIGLGEAISDEELKLLNRIQPLLKDESKA
jgi:hypothetical protein